MVTLAVRRHEGLTVIDIVAGRVLAWTALLRRFAGYEMSLREWMIEQLTSHGMWPKDAETVFKIIEDDPASQPMKDRWNDSVEGYPNAMKSVLWISAKQVALGWIDKNQPQAFYRQMFSA